MALLACLAAALAMSATMALGAEPPKCPANEQRRDESNINSATGEPYSAGLPDCRGYEVVSPPYKQGHDALPETTAGGLPVAPGGHTAGFWSQGVFAGAENFLVGEGTFSQYLSHLGAQEWTTSSTFAPRELLDVPYGLGINGDSTLDLHSLRLSCGQNPAGRESAREGGGIACVLLEPNGSWVPTPTYRALNGGVKLQSHYGGASSDLSRAFMMTTGSLALLPSVSRGYALYEISGVGSASPLLRLVNVDEGAELTSPDGVNQYLGANKGGGQTGLGSRYQAISASGESVFFTALPKKPPEVPTVYGRVPCRAGSSHCEYVEKVEDVEEVKQGTVARGGRVMSEGPKSEVFPETGRETVAVSNPSEGECEECLPMGERTPQEALFQGASADGSKVFFTTNEKLIKGNPDATSNLYEYDFNNPEGKKLVALSPDEERAEAGVIRSSADGSHVYFVARGKLKGLSPENTKNTTVNEKGEQTHEEVRPGQNIYAYGCEKHETQTPTCETKFVASAGVHGIASEFIEEPKDLNRPAQVTPDGRYLVFSSAERLAGELNQSPGRPFTGESVYRYDFRTGQLTWVSHGAPHFKNEREGKEAYKGQGESSTVPPLPGGHVGADANINDWDRAISGCPNTGERSEGEELEYSCAQGTHDGEYIIFVTSEKLQSNDENNAPDVYEWHCASPCEHPSAEGEVHMISDGRDPLGIALREQEGLSGSGSIGPEAADAVGMSASGWDVFFSTHTALVPQDADLLGDVYDAHADGGFPAPAKPSECSGEGCQGPQTNVLPFPDPISSLAPAGGNLAPGKSGPIKGPPAPSLTIAKAKLSGNAVLVTVNLSAPGTVRISGRGLKTTTRILSAGAHQVRVTLTKAGASLRRHHKKTTVHITLTLTMGKQAVAKTMTVRL
jgi:hypothetical protein